MKVKMTIGAKILGMLVFTILCTVYLMAALTFPRFEASITDASKHHLLDQVTAETETVRGVLETRLARMRLLEENSSVMFFIDRRNHSSYEARYQEELTLLQDSMSGISGMVLFDTEGKAIAGTDVYYKEADYTGAAALPSVLSGETEWGCSNVVRDREGKEAILLFLALHKDGHIVGAVASYVDSGLFEEEMRKCSVTGVAQLAAYITDADGVIFGHTEDGKIGTKVENDTITEVVQRLANGETVENGVATYAYHGVNKLAAYSVLQEGNWILCFSVNESEILGPILQVKLTAYAILTVLCVVFCLAGWFLLRWILRPLKETNRVLNQVAGFDFREDERYKRYTKTTDETGEMCKAICSVTEHLREEMLHINSVSEKLTDTANGMDQISGAVTQSAESNLESIAQISEGFGSTAAATEQISEEVGTVQNYMNEMESKIEEGVDKTNLLRERAEKLRTVAEEANHASTQMFTTVKQSMEAAMEKARSVEKISLFTESIMEISGQTKLLALNASIEAARAGEAGRGFAVVAGEIGNLAKQSTESADNISALVEEIYQAVTALGACLKQSLAYMEEHVIPDYRQFCDVSEEYSRDSDALAGAMGFLKEGIHEFAETMEHTVDSVVQISANVQESAAKIQNMEEENKSVTALIQKTYGLVQVNTKLSGELKEIVEKYAL